MFKIAIVGASTLLGKELKEAVADSPLAAADFYLFDEEKVQGQIDQIGDEVAIVKAVTADSFERMDFVFFCGSEEQTRNLWNQALKSGASVVDLTAGIDQEPKVVVASPRVTGGSGVDLTTPVVVSAHAAAIVLAMLSARAATVAKVRFSGATLLLPASEFGREAMDELHQQTITLLSFQGLPRAIYDAQTAYNLLSGLGESATANMRLVEDRIRRHKRQLLGDAHPQCALQVIHAPVFHGHSFSIVVDLESPIKLSALEAALECDYIELVHEDMDSPSNLAATGQDKVLVRIRPEGGVEPEGLVSRLWVWAASDNLRLEAMNAIDCALELAKLRPQGKVQ